jgi:SpoVK/Ycf46/Vps4 family AAA+-type ATPase
MSAAPDSLPGIIRVGPFAGFYQRFEELIASSRRMTLYFIHSRRWRENHDAAIKAFLRRSDTIMEIFLPDLENHELMFSISRRFEDGPLTPTLVVDAYRYCSRLAREYGKPEEIWLFGRYPAYSFYQFDERAIIALYSNTAAKKDIPAFEVSTDGLLGKFLVSDIEDLKKECRRRTPRELEAVIATASSSQP